MINDLPLLPILFAVHPTEKAVKSNKEAKRL
jgi:hypothetical protein